MKNAKARPGSTKASRKTIGHNGSRNGEASDSGGAARVSFDRFGHIDRINPAAAKLFDHSPLSMLGRPFARFIARQESEEFLHHLLRCRTKEKKVETNLHVKSGGGEKIPVRLSSVCVSASAEGVRFRYQTTISDLREEN